MRLSKMFFRACRLRCPRCGGDRIFRGWYRMRDACQVCGLKYQRAPGYFLGSIYFNYGVTALVLAIGYPLLSFAVGVPPTPLLAGSLAFCLLFPLWFLRYARSLWIGFDQFWDPTPMDEQDAVDT